MYKTRQLSKSIKYLSKLVTELEFVKSFTPVRFQKKLFFWPKIENGRCFTHRFWTNCQFLCNCLLKYKLTQVVLWKLKPEFGKFHIGYFCVTSWKFKCHLCHLWQIPCLACISVCELRIFAVQRKIDVRFSQIWQMPQFTFWQRMCAQFLSNSNWGFSGEWTISSNWQISHARNLSLEEFGAQTIQKVL